MNQLYNIESYLIKEQAIRNKNTEKVKKYRAQKKLQKDNSLLELNDKKRGSKLLSTKEKFIEVSNIALSKNPCRLKSKYYLKKRIRDEYADGENCFFFTLNYSDSDKVNMEQNTKNVERFYNYLKNSNIADSLIIIPEYHSSKYCVHNHGIIRVGNNFNGNIKSVIINHWSRYVGGGAHITALDLNRPFEVYIAKFLIPSIEYTYNTYDGLFIEDLFISKKDTVQTLEGKKINDEVVINSEEAEQPNDLWESKNKKETVLESQTFHEYNPENANLQYKIALRKAFKFILQPSWMYLIAGVVMKFWYTPPSYGD